jgi:Na+-translocating ferredoxin:NAD+ oxidoreductase RnfD subunit
MPRRVAKFLKTPKGLVTIILAILIVMAAPSQNVRAVTAGLASATIAAGLVDALILRVKNKDWEYPSGAVLTAAIVVMVLRSQEPWYVATVTSLIAILSKYVFRLRGANVFNPAALAMVGSYYLFHAGQSWWGAETDVNVMAKLVLIGTGLFITNRVNKMPLVLTFLGAYFALFTATAFVGDPLPVAEIFRTPDLEAVLYFAFLILTDPPTSPTQYRDQVVCGLMVALVSYACFELAGVVYYLLAGVLAGNVWQAWRRANRRTGYTFPRGLGGFLNEMAPWNRTVPAPPAN